MDLAICPTPEKELKNMREKLKAVKSRSTTHGPCFFAGPGDCANNSYLGLRASIVRHHFPGAFGVDDFMARTEIELCKYGFSGDTSIAMVNLCRDEICNSLKTKIEEVYGQPFNTHGLGGVLTCGVTGMRAGLSHAPLPAVHGTREKYIFFSFPHIAINPTGVPGHIGRPSRPDSHACGALIGVLGALKKEECKDSCHKSGKPEVHDVLDPEFSILKHRMEQHIAFKKIPHAALDLVSITKLAEEAITSDLETMIRHTVDVSKADYAVISGIQIHNWTDDFEDEEPNFEFIHAASTYVVINGKKTDLDLHSVSQLTSRMIRILNTDSPVAVNTVPALALPAATASKMNRLMLTDGGHH